ncbi:hypothetical protein [Nostoc parmelioides]|nr:hypothetical protein [Nostoc parmelioides]
MPNICIISSATAFREVDAKCDRPAKIAVKSIYKQAGTNIHC